MYAVPLSMTRRTPNPLCDRGRDDRPSLPYGYTDRANGWFVFSFVHDIETMGRVDPSTFSMGRMSPAP